MQAIERVVVQATPDDKRAFVAKAKALEMPLSELMRRGAFALATKARLSSGVACTTTRSMACMVNFLAADHVHGQCMSILVRRQPGDSGRR